MAMPAISERPPYVSFEMRSVEDRNASLEAGHYVGRDVPFIIATPAGSKDRIERVASEWFAQKRDDVRGGRFPQAWFDAYKNAFDSWLAGEEAPVEGTPLTDWPGLSPSLYKTLKGINVRTVEDVAGANEEVLQRIGMGARALKQRAIDWLAAASGDGKLAGEMETLRQQNSSLKEQNEHLESRLNEMAKTLEAMQAPAAKPAIEIPSLDLGQKL